jgi:hypothetical protein
LIADGAAPSDGSFGGSVEAGGKQVEIQIRRAAR